MSTEQAENTAVSKFGAVGKLDDGRTFVQFERHLAHSVEKVWLAITDPEQLARWFPGIELEREQGGSFNIWFGGECEGPAHVSGTVTEFDPPRLLQCGSMRWELTSAGSGCVLRFSDILHFEGPRSEAELTNSVLGGWHHYLDRLEGALDGVYVDPEQPEVDYSKVEVSGRD